MILATLIVLLMEQWNLNRVQIYKNSGNLTSVSSWQSYRLRQKPLPPNLFIYLFAFSQHFSLTLFIKYIYGENYTCTDIQYTSAGISQADNPSLKWSSQNLYKQGPTDCYCMKTGIYHWYSNEEIVDVDIGMAESQSCSSHASSQQPSIIFNHSYVHVNLWFREFFLWGM